MIRKKRRRDTEKESGNRERWLISYADFMTLLFAFFVVLYATSEKDKSEGKKFEESIKKFLVKVTAVGQNGSNGQSQLSKLLNQGGDSQVSAIEGPLNKFKRKHTQGYAENVKLQKKIEKKLEEKLNGSQLSNFIYDIHEDEWGVRLILSSKFLFSKNDIYFNKGAIKSLNYIGEILKNLDRPLFIEGHAGKPSVVSSNYPSEWELSSLRATRVLRYFSKKFNIDEKKLVSLSFGSQRPALPEDRKNQRNDRIEIVILSGDNPI